MPADRTRQFYKEKNVLETSFWEISLTVIHSKHRAGKIFLQNLFWMMEQNTL
jgi:hypothetical protein